jgi:hypothetical protein
MSVQYWACPGTKANADATLFSSKRGKYWWGTWSEKKYRDTRIGDNLFFYIHGKIHIYRSKVVSKTRLEDIGNERWWPFKRNHWTYLFEIEMPVETDITVVEFFNLIQNNRKTQGCLSHFQTQTKLKREIAPELSNYLLSH